MPDTTLNPTETPPSGGGVSKAWMMAVGLAVVLLGLTGYLTAASLTGDGRPVGCGDDAGCGAVLGTKWSKLLGIPVSGLATGLYVVVLATLLTRKQLGGVVLSTAAVAILGAGAWFTYLQLVELEAICKYCMVDHALGATLAVILLLGTTGRHLVPGAVMGVLGTAAMAGLQLTSDEPVFLVEGGGGTQTGQTLTLLDGRLTLDLHEELVLGDLEGDKIIVKMADYNCPHCRKAYHTAKQAVPDATFVFLPVPLNPACNAHQPELPREWFTHSCTLAKLALAIHRIDPTQLEAYDAWAYGDGWPNTAEAGLAFAETLVDPARLKIELADPALDAILKRNTDAWGQARAADLVGGLPVHLVPGGGLTYGGIGDGTSLVQLLDGVHHSQEPTDPAKDPQP